MVDLTSRQLTGPQSRSLHYSYEKAGQVIDNQPIPWNADAVLVEFQFRPGGGRRTQHSSARPAGYVKEDFTLRLSGSSLGVPAERVEQQAHDLGRVFFRFAVPVRNASAEILWRGYSLGQLQLPVFGADDFLRHFRLQMPVTGVQLDGETVQCQTAAATQCRNLVVSAMMSSATSLAPIIDLGPRVRMLTARADVCRDQQIHLSHSQLHARQALVSVVMPRPPRTGDWFFQWIVNDKVFAEQRLKTVNLTTLHRSLRVSATRFVVQYSDGRLVPARTLPSLEGVERIGPYFWVASLLPGLAGWVELEVRARPKEGLEYGKSISLCRQRVLLTDGPTSVLAGTLDVESFRQIKHFELRCRNRLVGVLPLESAPTAVFTSEGGFTPTEDFDWSHASEEELQEKLKRLLGKST
jgi:hypothetical protein